MMRQPLAKHNSKVSNRSDNSRQWRTMCMNRLLCMAGIVYVLAMSGPGVRLSAADAARPNVLFIAVDDLNPILSCYGHPDRAGDRTWIAWRPQVCCSGGLTARTICSICMPSRSSLLSGSRPESLRRPRDRSLTGHAPAGTITLPNFFVTTATRPCPSAKSTTTTTTTRTVGSADMPTHLLPRVSGVTVIAPDTNQLSANRGLAG